MLTRLARKKIRNLNPTSAAEMLTATLRWRDEFGVSDAVKEEFPDDIFGKLGYVYGKDKSGRPVTCVFIPYVRI
jgi:hypothetical protein